MKEPVWLSKEEILAVQEELLARFGGESGVRDLGLLDSGMNRPVQLFHYGKPSLFDLAASYASGIIKNHPFIDGNKRVGFLAAYIFLSLNGIELNSSEEDVFLKTFSLAASDLSEDEYANWLRESCD